MACLFPFFVKDVATPVPCGRCPNCITRRVNGWTFRIGQELRRATSVHWLRLSYDDNHLLRSPNGFPTLSKQDVQLWLKRIRKQTGIKGIKYYLCGEYGSRFKRPHYHVILMNCPLQDAIDCWADRTGMFGEVYVDPRPLTDDAIAYTVMYMSKGRNVPSFKNDDRVKEFALMSKRLGDNYLSLDNIAFHLADDSRQFLTTAGGGRVALPRYYSDKIYRPKAVGGFICPVARLAFDIGKDARSFCLILSF